MFCFRRPEKYVKESGHLHPPQDTKCKHRTQIHRTASVITQHKRKTKMTALSQQMTTMLSKTKPPKSQSEKQNNIKPEIKAWLYLLLCMLSSRKVLLVDSAISVQPYATVLTTYAYLLKEIKHKLSSSRC